MARENLFIKVGTYTGDGNDDRTITGVGFQPDFILVKGGANSAVFRVKQMVGDTSGYWGVNTANLANAIQGLTSDGFVVGTNAVVNANATVYYYVAMKGYDSQKYFKTGRYAGTGGDDREYRGGEIDFTPEVVIISGDTAQHKAFKSDDMAGETTSHISARASVATDYIQSLIASGFELGTSALVNGSGIFYHFLAFKDYVGVMAHGTYTGNAVDDRDITGIGFQPDVVIVKNRGTTDHAILRTSSFSGDSSAPLGALSPTTNMIQGIVSDGFRVGTNARVNADTNTYDWLAFKDGNFNVPIERTAV